MTSRDTQHTLLRAVERPTILAYVIERHEQHDANSVVDAAFIVVTPLRLAYRLHLSIPHISATLRTGTLPHSSYCHTVATYR